MRRKRSEEKGFTLIEVIVTLILVGITAALAGMWIVHVASGYVFAIQNANTVQKGQLAITRIAKELNAIQSIASSSDTSIVFNRADNTGNPAGIAVTISKNGNTLQLNGNTLTDNVSTTAPEPFLNYCDDNLTSPICSSSWSTTPNARIIIVTFTLTGASDTPSKFTIRAKPRNI